MPQAGKGHELIRSGAEVVELTERFYRGIFVGIAVFVAVSAIAALVLLPLRADSPPVTGIVGGAAVLICTPFVLWRADWTYRLLRRRLDAELAIVLLAAALVSVVRPLRSQLWWPSCTLLMLVAVVAPIPRVIAYCLIVLVLNLIAHVIDGDIHNTPPVSIIGLWIGYIFWSLTVALVTDRLAAHLMQLNRLSPAARPPAVRVATYRSDQAAGTSTGEPTGPVVDEGHPTAQSAAPLASGEHLSRLTARQLEVIALLADGLRYREAAACLSISVGQVGRHASQAVRRLGLSNVAELIAVAVAEGLVPSQSGDLASVSSQHVRSNVDKNPA